MTADTLSRRAFVAGSMAVPLLASAAAAPRIKIGQIGTGHAHAGGKMETIRKYPDLFELLGVVEPEAGLRRAAAAQKGYQGVRWMEEAELLAAPGLQAVAVETRVVDLVPAALRCIEAGMHVHLDKPAGESMDACRQLHRAADERGLTIQMGYMLRYNPAFEFLRTVLAAGWLGDIMEVNGMMGKKMNAAGRLELSQYQGGGMFELACHLIDATVTVLGKPLAITPFTHRTYPAQDSFADNQLAVFDYPAAIATIRCNHNDPMGGVRRQFSVTGTLGTVAIQPLEPPKLLLGLDRPREGYKAGFQEVVLPPSAGRYDGDFLDLARVIRGEKKLAWNSVHDLIVHEAVLRASGTAG